MAQRRGSRTLPLWLSVGFGAVLFTGLNGCTQDDSSDALPNAGPTTTSGGSTSVGGGGVGGTTAAAIATSTGGASSSAPSGSTLSATAAEYVTATNAVRAAVTEPASYTLTWVPLPNVTWSDTVAASAQAWADHLAQVNNCGLEHETQNAYGENLAAGSNLSPTQAVNMWAGEANLYTWSAKYTMNDFNAGSGHYTQLVWRKSIQIGCGSATCGRSVVISCRYSPPGNMIGAAVY